MERLINRYKQFRRIATRYEKRGQLPSNVAHRRNVVVVGLCKYALVFAAGFGHSFHPADWFKDDSCFKLRSESITRSHRHLLLLDHHRSLTAVSKIRGAL
jgi:hypothetical protein